MYEPSARSLVSTRIAIQTDAPPLRRDETGAKRAGTSRVRLELVIHACRDGKTPEEIVEAYSTTTLPDIDSVIGYYLRHRKEVGESLDEREKIAVDVRQRIEAQHGDLAELREQLRSERNG